MTSTSNTPRKLPVPFGIRYMVCQVASSDNQPSLNIIWTRSTIFIQLVGLGAYSMVSAARHPYGCSTHIPHGPHNWLERRLCTDHSTSASENIKLSTRNWSMVSGLVSLRGGTLRYSSTYPAVIRLIVTQAGGRERSTKYLNTNTNIYGDERREW